MPVSAKMRLGTATTPALDCAQAIADAGADELVVHARTKDQGYRPPAYWEHIADIRAARAVPVMANGEVWTWPMRSAACTVSGCDAPDAGPRHRGRPRAGLAFQLVPSGSSGA
jgi:tRNA-dihydrouridine synthase C